MTKPAQQGYGPPKTKKTPTEPILDRFGIALTGPLIAHTNYSNNISGLPVHLSQQIPGRYNDPILTHARSALMNSIKTSSLTGAVDVLYSAGARIIHLAQCVREAGLCQEYLEYSTLPEDNKSGLFDSPWAGVGDRYVGDIKEIYDATKATLSYTAPMFDPADRDQYDNHPLIPFRLAYYIKAFLDESYKKA